MEQGSLEIPCLLLFQADQELLEKAHKLLLSSEKSASVAKVSGTFHKIKQEPEQEVDVVPEAKRIKLEHTTESENSVNVPPKIWAMLIERNQRLTDKHITFAQAMLRGQFPQCDGLQNTLLQGGTSTVQPSKWYKYYMFVVTIGLLFQI